MARKKKSYEDGYPFDIDAMAEEFKALREGKSIVPDDLKVPDLTEAVIGWRAWGVSTATPRFGSIRKLQAVTFTGYEWQPGVPARAECDRTRSKGDNDHVPGEHCSCGFYSAKDLGHLMSMTYHLYDAEARGCFHVIGKVANWGKVVEGTQGWRAEYSYPLALFVPYEAHYLARALGDAYRVPVHLKDVLGAHAQLNQRRTRRSTP